MTIYPSNPSDPRERKKGKGRSKLRSLDIQVLDDGSYTVCSYTKDHMDTKKISAQDSEDLIEKIERLVKR